MTICQKHHKVPHMRRPYTGLLFLLNIMKKKYKFKLSRRFSFILLVIAAIFISQIPVLHVPFSWMQTFFHEISHGLTAILTGGAIVSVQLNLDGSGLCTSLGGWTFLIAFSGYVGAVLWGVLIYVLSCAVKDRNAFVIALFIIGLIVACMVFWTSNFITLLVLGGMLIPFTVALKARSYFIEKYFLQFSGIYVLIDAIKSPFVLLFIHDRGDDFALSVITGLPQIFWVFLWILIGLISLFFVFKYSH